tara:strand:+ start:134 stop:400 length:267 start_codon:yes stop_codon:yes gene_type:complete
LILESSYEDEQGNPIFLIDYIGKGWWGVFANYEAEKPLKKSKSVRTLVKKVAATDYNDPQIEMSDGAEKVFCLEVSGGKKFFNKELGM